MTIKPLKVKTLFSLVGAIFSLMMLGCSPTSNDEKTSEAKFSPNSNQYIPETDPEKYQVLAAKIWSILSAQACWDASYVGESNIGGTPASVSQFTFFNADSYRHFGFSINTGRIAVQSLGRYNGKLSGIIMTWSGEWEGLVILDNNRFEHVLTSPGGSLFSNQYRATKGPCL